MQLADFLSAVFFYLKVGENLNQNWIVENLNNAFSTWNGKLGELWGLVTTGPQTFKGGAVWSVMQTLHNGMVGIGYALVVLFFAISLCKNTMNFHELKRPEAAIHYFLRFVAAKALVGYGILNVAVRGEIAFALSATTPGRLTVCRLTGFTDILHRSFATDCWMIWPSPCCCRQSATTTLQIWIRTKLHECGPLGSL